MSEAVVSFVDEERHKRTKKECERLLKTPLPLTEWVDAALMSLGVVMEAHGVQIAHIRMQQKTKGEAHVVARITKDLPVDIRDALRGDDDKGDGR